MKIALKLLDYCVWKELHTAKNASKLQLSKKPAFSPRRRLFASDLRPPHKNSQKTVTRVHLFQCTVYYWMLCLLRNDSKRWFHLQYFFQRCEGSRQPQQVQPQQKRQSRRRQKRRRLWRRRVHLNHWIDFWANWTHFWYHKKVDPYIHSRFACFFQKVEAAVEMKTRKAAAEASAEVRNPCFRIPPCSSSAQRTREYRATRDNFWILKAFLLRPVWPKSVTHFRPFSWQGAAVLSLRGELALLWPVHHDRHLCEFRRAGCRGPRQRWVVSKRDTQLLWLCLHWCLHNWNGA